MIRFLWLDKNKFERAFKIQSMYVMIDFLFLLTYLCKDAWNSVLVWLVNFDERQKGALGHIWAN